MNLFNISIDIIGNSSIFRIIKVYTLFIHLSILLSKKILNFQTLLGGMAVFAFPPAHCLDRFSSQAVTPGRRIMFKRRFIITHSRLPFGPLAGFPKYYYKCAFCALCAFFKKSSIFLLIRLLSKCNLSPIFCCVSPSR